MYVDIFYFWTLKKFSLNKLLLKKMQIIKFLIKIEKNCAPTFFFVCLLIHLNWCCRGNNYARPRYLKFLICGMNRCNGVEFKSNSNQTYFFENKMFFIRKIAKLTDANILKAWSTGKCINYLNFPALTVVTKPILGFQCCNSLAQRLSVAISP